MLGLTAPCSDDIGDAMASLAKICDELLIVNKETATHQELEASGYQDTRVTTEGSSRPVTITTPGTRPEADRSHQQDASFLRRGEEMGGSINFVLWLIMAWVCSMVAIGASDAARLAKLQAVESAARGVLVNFQARYGLGAGVSPNGEPIPSPGARSALDLFVARTNAILEEPFRQEPVSRLWVYTLSYESDLRKLQSSGEGTSGKKVAKRLAAARLVADLLDEVPA